MYFAFTDITFTYLIIIIKSSILAYIDTYFQIYHKTNRKKYRPLPNSCSTELIEKLLRRISYPILYIDVETHFTWLSTASLPFRISFFCGKKMCDVPLISHLYISHTYSQRRSHGGILGILRSPREPHGPQAYMGPGRSMNCMAEESKCVSGNGHLT